MPEVHIAGTQNLDVNDPAKEIVVGNYQVAPKDQNDKELSSDPSKSEMSTTETFAQDYDKVSIPDDLFQEQSDGDDNTNPAETTASEETAKLDDSTDENESNESDSVNEQTHTASDDSETPVSFKTEDGSEYTQDDVLAWKKDADNRNDWSKSNTEKAQEIADQRRAMEPFLQLVNQLKKTEDFSDTLFEAIEDELGKEAGQLFKETLSADNTDLPNPWADELKQAQDQLAQMESQQALDKSMVDLQSSFKLDKSQAQIVLDYAIKTHEDTGRLLTLEEAYKVMNFDKVRTEIKAKPKKPSLPVNVKKSVGVKAEAIVRPESYDDIDITSFFN